MTLEKSESCEKPKRQYKRKAQELEKVDYSERTYVQSPPKKRVKLSSEVTTKNANSKK